ncbi:hypothetical protein C8Z91_25850 [Paenibacillus elgii]|uniref:Uncharacterized protein n=1 Tax=Paenibacillus elgii TaxID=189691 RepID=A0A2T6FY39_9BACL|nr:hypothetical protein C8Z91_25850 [Paenibacillus elgii]
MASSFFMSSIRRKVDFSAYKNCRVHTLEKRKSANVVEFTMMHDFTTKNKPKRYLGYTNY